MAELSDGAAVVVGVESQTADSLTLMAWAESGESETWTHVAADGEQPIGQLPSDLTFLVTLEGELFVLDSANVTLYRTPVP